MKLFFHAFACAAACLASSGALARPTIRTVSSTNTEIVRSTAVRFSDLDLASPRDQRRLDARLRAAAVDVCRAPRSDGGAVGWFSLACYKAAIADARARVRSDPVRLGDASAANEVAPFRQ